MEESEFKLKSGDVYNKIMNAFDDIDPDDAEPFFHLDNITITFRNGVKFIVNRQTPARQIWLATKKKGLHFNYNAEKSQWLCSKTSSELFRTLSEAILEELGEKVVFS